jgi:1-deoxy-D-xylulose-5-phosphate reductoisomerase
VKNIVILGATGSIGTQTLDVIEKEKDSFKLIAISVNKNYEKTIEIIIKHNPRYVAVMDQMNRDRIKEYCRLHGIKTEILVGTEGLAEIASLEESDIVVTSVVGMIGLMPTISAIRAGKQIALANKETLVVAGKLVTNYARERSVDIIPVDSEHCAVFQCLQGNDCKAVEKIILTASGGPFRGKNSKEISQVNADEALRHPKWSMGKKISIDSATLMNKGLEVIEAHWLFGVDYKDIDVIVHPESIIHSMVEYQDGSVMAQMATADMRLPIQYALNYPERSNRIVSNLDFSSLGTLTFEKPDMDTFRCLKLAYDAGRIGGLMTTILNGANEACVELFLNKKIAFNQISEIIEQCMMKFDYTGDITIESIIDLDKRVKDYINNTYNKGIIGF